MVARLAPGAVAREPLRSLLKTRPRQSFAVLRSRQCRVRSAQRHPRSRLRPLRAVRRPPTRKRSRGGPQTLSSATTTQA
eukprot:3714664-Prymnesium_polylepis.1